MLVFLHGETKVSTKIYPDAASALKDIVADGITVAAGGFDLCGVPLDLIMALRDSNAKNLTVIGNNTWAATSTACGMSWPTARSAR